MSTSAFQEAVFEIYWAHPDCAFFGLQRNPSSAALETDSGHDVFRVCVIFNINCKLVFETIFVDLFLW